MLKPIAQKFILIFSLFWAALIPYPAYSDNITVPSLPVTTPGAQYTEAYWQSIIDFLTNLSCPTVGIAGLLESEFAHTCTPDSFASFAIGNVVAPGIYPATILVTRMNDDKINGIQGNCKRANRANPADPKIKFAVCNNISLAAQQGSLVLDTVKAAITAALSGNDPFVEFTKGLQTKIPRNSYFDSFELGNGGTTDYYKALMPPLILYKAEVKKDKICITIPTLIGRVAIGCKYLYEPQPYSKFSSQGQAIYSAEVTNNLNNPAASVPAQAEMISNASESFEDINLISSKTSLISHNNLDSYNFTNRGTLQASYAPDSVKVIDKNVSHSLYAANTSSNVGVSITPLFGTATYKDYDPTSTCNSIAACVEYITKNSRTVLPISGSIVFCLKESLKRVLINPHPCDGMTGDVDYSRGSTINRVQAAMHNGVVALLTLYVILFGFKIVLGQGRTKSGEVILAIVKIVLVAYFSIGLNSSSGNRYDGMSTYATDILLNGANQLATIVVNMAALDNTSSENNIVTNSYCTYRPSDYSLENDKTNQGFLALWDTIDCKIGHYLGINSIFDLYSKTKGKESLKDNTSFSVPPYFYLLLLSLKFGSWTLFQIALSYPLMVISVAAHMVTSFLMSLLMASLLGILAPLFVPMYLFQWSRGYFESWFRLLISFILQPVITVTFMVLMFGVYDVAFYKSCKFKALEVTLDGKKKVGYYLNTDSDDYEEDDFKTCEKSLGFIFNSSVARAVADALPSASSTTLNLGSNVSNAIFEGMSDSMKYMNSFALLGSTQKVVGMFMDTMMIMVNQIIDIIFEMLSCLLVLYLMYHFSEQLVEFAADLSQGISLKGMTIDAQSISKAASAGIDRLSVMKGENMKSNEARRDRTEGVASYKLE